MRCCGSNLSSVPKTGILLMIVLVVASVHNYFDQSFATYSTSDDQHEMRPLKNKHRSDIHESTKSAPKFNIQLAPEDNTNLEKSLCPKPSEAPCCSVTIKQLSTTTLESDEIVAGIYINRKLKLEWRPSDHVVLQIVHDNCSTSLLLRGHPKLSTFDKTFHNLPDDLHVVGIVDREYGKYFSSHRMIQQLRVTDNDYVGFVYVKKIQGASKGIALSLANYTGDSIWMETCFPTNMEIDTSIQSWESIATHHNHVILGGSWGPRDCVPQWKIAVIVPFRDRMEHLQIFVKHMHSFLRHQNVKYTIYIVEHTCPTVFNRAAMMNIGFLEGMKRDEYDCMFIQDVDLLPERVENLYHCGENPRHLVVTRNRTRYYMFSKRYFGGGVMMTPTQIRGINGFTNKIYGWGGEDNNAYLRVMQAGYYIDRYKPEIASYTMLSHGWDPGNPRNNIINGEDEGTSPDRDERTDATSRSLQDFIPYIWDEQFHPKNDGLSSIEYSIVGVKEYPLFTHILTTIPGPSLDSSLSCNDSTTLPSMT